MQKHFPFLTNYRLVCLLWIAVAAFCWHYKFKPDRYNNYLIFKQVYYHTKAETNLYKFYPTEYYDSNHYGPVFSVFVAPFAVLPDGWGLFFWSIASAAFLLWAVHLLPVDNKIKMLILLFSSIEFANTVHNIQFNTMVTAIIIFSFVLVERGKDQWATLLTIMGALIKLYPIVGLAFFMFSKNKSRFVWTSLLWTVVCVCLPMLITSPQFALNSYVDWFHSLSEKNLQNIAFNAAQDISFMGVIRKLTAHPFLSNLPFLIFGAAVFGIPLLRFNQYSSLTFRLKVLASGLLTVVLFSTGSEHPTYVIAVVGAMLWIFLQEKPFTPRNIGLLVSILVITGLGLTDAFPQYIREKIISDYYMKAWPCIIVWFMIAADLMFKDHTANETAKTEYNLADKELLVF